MERSMHAGVEFRDLLSVTDTAIHGVFYRLAGAFLRDCHIRMALGAGRIRMGRVFEGFLVDKQANGLAIARYCQVRLTVAGQAVIVGQTVRVKDPANLVRRMAIDTGRNLGGILEPQATLDDLAVYAFNLAMAVRAGLRHIVRVNAGLRISMRQYVVRRMAGRADGGDRETLTKQAFPVNTHRVVFEDGVLRDVMGLGDRGPFLVTGTAKHRHIHDRRWRSRVGC